MAKVANMTRRSARQQSKEPDAATTALPVAEASTAPVNTTTATASRGGRGRHSRDSSLDESLTAPVAGAAAARKQQQQSARRQNLDTVPETDNQQPEDADDNDVNFLLDTDGQADVHDHSRLSGATAVETSLSQDEMSTLRTKGTKLFQNLAALDSPANIILNAVIVTDSQSKEAADARLAEVAQVGSPQSMILTAFPFNPEEYSNGTQYIPVELMVPAMFSMGSLAHSGRDDIRPDNVLYRVNLAALAKALLPLSAQSPDVHGKLSAAYQSFPHEFSSFPIAPPSAPTKRLTGKTLISEATFAMVLEFRTQYAMQTLRKVPAGTDPTPLFEEIWNCPDDTPIREFWGISHMNEPNANVSEDRERRVKERAEVFRSSLSDAERSYIIDHAQLDQQFPWQPFLAQLLLWISKIHGELDSRIAHAGGASSIASKLKDKLAPPPPPPPPPPVATPKDVKSGMRKLNSITKSGERKATPKAQPKAPAKKPGRKKKVQPVAVAEEPVVQPAPELQPEEPQVPPDPNIDPSLQDSANAALVATAIAAGGAYVDDGLSHTEQQIRTHLPNVDQLPNAGSLFNPQANASKTVFDDNLTQQTPNDGDNMIPENPFADPTTEDIQPTPDQGYASQEPTVKTGKKRQADSAASGKASKKSRKNPGSSIPDATEDPTNDPDYENAAEDAEETAPAKPAAKQKTKGTAGRRKTTDNVPAAPADYRPPPSDYRSVNLQAKTVQAFHGRKPQPKRRPWEPEETDALIDYIEKYGTSWSYIKAVDKEAQWLHERSQVDLKDKARNMKMDYLKSGVALPKNFETIQLDRKATDKLAALGIDYSQLPKRASRTTREIPAAEPTPA